MRCKKLPAKLRQIREALGHNLPQMARVLGFGLLKQHIFNYELPHDDKNNMEPPLPVLLRYARLAGVCPSVLIDDKLRLPPSIPTAAQHKELD